MSTLYPGAVDDTTTLPPPGPNTVTNAGSVTHAVLHDNEILALQALETKLGIGASTSTASTVLRASSAGTSTWGKVVLTSDVSGTLPVANGGTGVTSSTGSGANVLANSPALVTPTGIVKGDVGLGNVDNTSDTTKNAAAVVLTNKDLTSATNIFPSGSAVQQVSTLSSAVATGGTTIPLDNTLPQNTEGDQYMTLSITPKSTTNTLEIDCTISVANSSVVHLIGALFQDSTANALAAINAFQGTAGGNVILRILHTMVAGTTSSTTFKIRAGGSSAGTTTFNGAAGGQLFSTATKSSMVIREYKA